MDGKLDKDGYPEVWSIWADKKIALDLEQLLDALSITVDDSDENIEQAEADFMEDSN